MNWKKIWKEQQSTITSALAALVIVGMGFLIFNATSKSNNKTNNSAKDNITSISTSSAQKNTAANQDNSKNQVSQSATENKQTTPTKVTYTVAVGDSLSKIAQQFYGDGSKWTLLASENHLANPSLIHRGNVLTIPALNQATQTPAVAAIPPTTASKTHTYTVVKGDSLWSIAEHFYGSGFSWTKILDANKSKIGTLPNGRPKLFVGTVLTIPTT